MAVNPMPLIAKTTKEGNMRILLKYMVNVMAEAIRCTFPVRSDNILARPLVIVVPTMMIAAMI